MIKLTLYTRPGCHLCDTLKAIVVDVARQERITLREIDISGDAGLEHRFGAEIPVLMCGEQLVARVRTNRAALLESLRQVKERTTTHE